MNKPNCLALLVLLSCFIGIDSTGLVCSQALAQQKSAAPSYPRPRLKNSQNPEFKAERVASPMQLPDVPMYPGKGTEFVTGTIFRKVKGGPSLTMQFSMKDSPRTVLQWYKDTLAANGWTSLSNTAGSDGLAVMKDKNICQIMVLPPSKMPNKCDLMVRYKFYKPTDFSAN